MKNRKYAIVGILLIILAVIFYTGIFPVQTKIPPQFVFTADLQSIDNFYDLEKKDFGGESISKSNLEYRLIEQNADVATIQGLFEVRTIQGELVFSSKEIYLVNVKTGEHILNSNKTTQQAWFFAPENKLRAREEIPFLFIGINEPVNLTFVRNETINGLETYHYQGTILSDLTEGYQSLDLVPEVYRVKNTITIDVWFEPITGKFVVFSDKAQSDFYSTATGEKAFPRNKYINTFTKDSVALQAQKTQTELQQIMLYRFILPLILVLFALICIVIDIFSTSRTIALFLLVSFLAQGTISWFIGFGSGLFSISVPFSFMISIIISFAIGLVLTSFFVKPIQNICTSIEKISKGNFNVTIEESNIIEINQLINSINRILVSMKLAITHLKKERLNTSNKEKGKNRSIK